MFERSQPCSWANVKYMILNNVLAHHIIMMFSFILQKINVFPCNYFLIADPYKLEYLSRKRVDIQFYFLIYSSISIYYSPIAWWKYFQTYYLTIIITASTDHSSTSRLTRIVYKHIYTYHSNVSNALLKTFMFWNQDWNLTEHHV